jgi:hypothetical protein
MATPFVKPNLAGRSVALLRAIVIAVATYLLLHVLLGQISAVPPADPDHWLLYFGLPWILLAPALVYVTDRFQRLPVYDRFNTFFLAACGVILPTIHTLLIMLLIAALPRQSIMIDTTLLQRGMNLAFLLLQQGFLLFDVLIIVAVFAVAALRLQQKQLHYNDQESYRLNRHLAETRLQNLSMQLNPHFLFNTLNGLSVLIDKQDNEQASEMVGELSKFLRQVLRTTREKWVTLEQELEFIRQYLRIEQYRFGKRLTWFEDCEPLALTAHIPPMLLQPLFENAIVHGLADKQGDCRLGFECRLYDRFLILHVFDNGDGLDEAHDTQNKSGIGLTNVKARLRELYGDSYSLNIERKADGTMVTLKLPAFKDSQFRQTPE